MAIRVLYHASVISNLTTTFDELLTVFYAFKYVTRPTTWTTVFKLITDVVIPTVYATGLYVFAAVKTRLRNYGNKLPGSYRK